MRFFSFVSMLLLVYVHGYNLENRYLQPFSLVHEPLTVTAYFEYFMANGLLRFRIPMLFIISGYLFAAMDDAPFGKRIRKRFRTLMVPYFLWSLIGLGLAVALSQWSVTETSVYRAQLQPSGKPFPEYTGNDWLAAILWPTSFQLWFIRCLFFYNLLYPVLLKGLEKIPRIVFGILAILWLSQFGMVVVEGEGLLFFTLGVYISKQQKNVVRRPRWFSLRWSTMALLLICALKTGLAFLPQESFGLPLTMLLLHKAVVALGLLVAWYGLDDVVRTAMRKRWFVSLSQFAFFIYALHVPLITYLIDPVHALVQDLPFYRLLTFLILPLLVIFFCIGVGAALRFLVPGVYATLTGNRGLVKEKPLQPVVKKPAPVAGW